MLDRFDRRISDRYKLIDYKEEDDQKEIIYFSNEFFAEISVPIMSGIATEKLKRELTLFTCALKCI